jgi:CheY-like chemotaxis protein
LPALSASTPAALHESFVQRARPAPAAASMTERAARTRALNYRDFQAATRLWHALCVYKVREPEKRNPEATMNAKNRILVIDDEEVVRRSFTRALDDEHCSVEQAGNGAAGLQALERQGFDVVLLDLRMPGMDGIEVLGRIKSRWPNTEVIVITGYPALDTAKQAVRLGAYDYLAKPVGCDEVAHATRNAIEHKHWALEKVAAA